MQFFVALMVGSALGTAAARFQDRRQRVGVIGMVVLLVAAFAGAVAFATDLVLVVIGLLTMSFVAGYLAWGSRFTDRRRHPTE